MPADFGSEIVIMHFGGQRSDGRRYVTSQLLVSGSGASPHLDGVDVIETDASNCLNVPAEALMMEAPIRVHRVALHCDSGGPGKSRGGLGGVFEYELLDGEATVTYRGERHMCEADGVADGMAGGRASAVIRRADGGEEVVKSKIVSTLRKGDRMVIATAGGGGHGSPVERDSGFGAGGSAQRQGQPGGGARTLCVSRQCVKQTAAAVDVPHHTFSVMAGRVPGHPYHHRCRDGWPGHARP